MKKYIVILMLTFLFSCSDKTSSENTAEQETKIPKTTKSPTKESTESSFVGISNDSTTFTFSQDFVKDNDIKENDIVVLNIGEGFLKKIEKIEEINGQVRLTTNNAALSEAIERGKATFNQELELDGNQVIHNKKEGFFLNAQENRSFNKRNKKSGLKIDIDIDAVLYDEDGNYGTDDDQVVVSGNYSMTPNITGDLSIDWFKIEEFNVLFSIEENISLSSSIDLANLEVEKEKVLKTIKFKTFTALIGGVPVLLTPELEFVAGMDLNVNSSIETGIGQTAIYKAGLSYKDSKWSKISSIEKTTTFQEPTLNANASCRFYLKPVFKIKIYGTVSPSLFANVYGELTADINKTPWWEIYAGLNVGVGANMDILSLASISYEAIVIDKKYVLAKATDVPNTPPTANFTVSPNSGTTETTFQFDASQSSDTEDDFTSLKFSWDFENDGAWDIENSSNYKPTKKYSSSGNYTAKLQVTDSKGSTNDTSLSIVVSSGSIPNNGLVAYYPFNGNANDESGNSNNGEMENVTITDGAKGTGLDFSGNYDAVVSIKDNSLLNITGDITVSAWVKKTGNWRSSHPMILSKNPVNHAYILWVSQDRTSLENSEFAFRVNINGVYDKHVYSGVTPEIGTWYHVVGVRSGTSLQIYVDGQLKNETQIPSDPISVTNNELTIGNDNISGSRGAFNGSIDEVRLYEKALTEQEIGKLFDESKPENGLIAYYPFNGNAEDKSGNQIHGTVHGASLASDRKGISNSAYSFDGSENKITFPTSEILRAKNYSISLWIKTTHSGSSANLFGCQYHVGNNSAAGGYELLIRDDGKINVHHMTRAYGNWGAITTESYNDNTWHHIVATYDGNISRLYVDGQQKAEYDPTNTQYVSGDIYYPIPYHSNFYSGNNWRPMPYNGKIDDIRVYNKALSENEITVLFGE